MSIFFQLGYNLQKSAVARWRTPSGIAKIVSRFGFVGDKRLRPEVADSFYENVVPGDGRTARLQEASHWLDPKAFPDKFQGLKGLRNQVNAIPAENIRGYVPDTTQPPRELFRGTTNADPWTKTHLGPGAAHGTPHPGVAADYGAKIFGRRLVTQHAASPTQRYGPDWSLENNYPGYTWAELQKNLGINRPVDKLHGKPGVLTKLLSKFVKPEAAVPPKWLESMPSPSLNSLLENDTTLYRLRNPSTVERLLRRIGLPTDGVNLSSARAAYETALTPKDNPLQRMLLLEPGSGLHKVRALPNTARWLSILKQLTRTE
jgi:hypothetical protein